MHTYKVNTGRELTLEGEVARLKEENAQLRSDRSGMQDCIQLRENQIGELKEKVSDLEYVEDALSQANWVQNEMRKREKELKTQLVEWRDRSMGYTKEIGELKSELEELSKAYKDSTREEVTMKKAWREQRELVALRDDQIAMLERRLAKRASEND